MDNTNEKLKLKHEIQILRNELDSLLNDHDPSSSKILELSRKLDILIIKYYNLHIEDKDLIPKSSH